MSDVEKVILRSGFDIDAVTCSGSDELICQAARVSTLGADSINSEESRGLINFLMKNRHGTPFEHNSMTFRISAPIFVWREFMRHRIGFSYNEESGRYRELEPVFYAPDRDRPLVQVGKAGAYDFVPGSMEQWEIAFDSLAGAYDQAWYNYQHMLNHGIAKEVARMCLPVSIYSTAYVTCNTRSLMAFLSLRTKDETSMFPSFPMQEINKVATGLEALFSKWFPITHWAFHTNGRVSP